MHTPSHWLMTAALHKGLQRTTTVPSAFLLGSVVPDMPLYLLSLGGTIYYRLFLGWSSQATFRQMFDYLYFQHPVWIAAHNLLHSPTLLLLALMGLGSLWSPSRTWLRWCLWFGLACLLHSAVDIVTHVDDGPLLLFPFEWTVRFQSPVSYWDSTHYGREFTVFELTLDVLLLGYLYGPRMWSWLIDTAYQRPANVIRDQDS
jgi:Zinc dependent phospholipase C